MEIKLSEVQKELNIGLGSLRPFLEEHGIAQGATPNTRIDKKTAQLIIDEFRPKIGKEEGEKLLALFAAEKKKESKPSKAAPSQESEKTLKEEISEPYSPSNVTEQTPTLKILGHLDKSGKAVMNDKPIELEKVDDTTVLFKLPSVSASAMEMLSDEVSIIPKHIFEGKSSTEINLLEEKVVGAGPYVLEEYKTGEYLKFKANPDYVKGKPYIENLIYRIIEKSDTATLSMQGGEADAYVASPDMLDPYKDNEAFTIHNYSEGRVPYIRLNVACDSMKDKKYREGILQALNRDEIMLAAYTDKSFYELGYSFLPYDNKYYTDDVEKWDQNVDKAKELVAGGATKLKLCYISNSPVLEKMALAIQSELKAVGIEVELAGTNDAGYIKATNDLESTEYDMFIGGYVMGSDPDTFAMLFSSKKDNRMNYHSEEIDNLFAEGNATLDDTKRQEIYKKVQRLVSEEAIYYPLGTNLRTLITKSNVDPEEAMLVPIYTFGDLAKLKFK